MQIYRSSTTKKEHTNGLWSDSRNQILWHYWMLSVLSLQIIDDAVLTTKDYSAFMVWLLVWDFAYLQLKNN